MSQIFYFLGVVEKRKVEKIHKTVKILSFPRDITLRAEKMVVATYAGELFKTVLSTETKNSYLRVVSEKMKKKK